jgi:hypothetical protein
LSYLEVPEVRADEIGIAADLNGDELSHLPFLLLPTDSVLASAAAAAAAASFLFLLLLLLQAASSLSTKGDGAKT